MNGSHFVSSEFSAWFDWAWKSTELCLNSSSKHRGVRHFKRCASSSGTDMLLSEGYRHTIPSTTVCSQKCVASAQESCPVVPHISLTSRVYTDRITAAKHVLYFVKTTSRSRDKAPNKSTLRKSWQWTFTNHAARVGSMFSMNDCREELAVTSSPKNNLLMSFEKVDL